MPSSSSEPSLYPERTLLGKGTLGHLYKASEADGTEIVLREIRLPKKAGTDPKQEAMVSDFTALVDELSKLEHKNLVRYLGTAVGNALLLKQQYIVDSQPLSQIIQKKGKCDEKFVKPVARQILSALAFLHASGRFHRNLKPGCIFVCPDGTVYVADFELGKQILYLTNPSGPGFFTMAGSVFYVAPETLKDDSLATAQGDVYSLGCIIIETLTGKAPFSEEVNVMKAIMKITSGQPPVLPEGLTVDMKDFLLKALSQDPAVRPDAKASLLHPLFH
eukprot:NODE_2224_length_1258_cov_44.865178_g2025_i0.p1 GENE.NODE_2224_length_1258_cov_44.865178_g2025_i0~~NODE_2224_length_1258_cov_44.865178_g2025_i0.p1  ORF type:complete len:276 (+),score=53.24 NODE_2224_length_1258_cov_44.865178_g2025_i0:109-936(+)